MNEVTLEEMLEARDRRVQRQQKLQAQWHSPLIYLTMNIPGPEKLLPGVRAAFMQAICRVNALLEECGVSVLQRSWIIEHTGCEGWWLADAPAKKLKVMMQRVEDSEDIRGRLLDLDVLDRDGRKLSRETMRCCLLCNRPAVVCARSRAHSVSSMTQHIRYMLSDLADIEKQADCVSIMAEEALLEEAELTPKPGLVDQRDCGAHSDMDIAMFRRSAAAVAPYIGEMFLLGRIWTDKPEQLFMAVRPVGMQAERAMLNVTGGVNTHKGAVFVLGVLAAASGKIMQTGGVSSAQVLTYSQAMCQRILAEELAVQKASGYPGDLLPSHGEQVYIRYGAKGVRGEAAEGFPSVYAAVEALMEKQKCFADRQVVLLYTLLELMSSVEDTTVLHRTGIEGLEKMRRAAKHFLEHHDLCVSEGLEALEEMNRYFMRENISPGGCADVLSATIFLEKLSILPE